MDHNAVYNRIIENARIRKHDPSVYYERHHIIPRCLGGQDTDDNLVYLTAREHFICHALLVYMTTGQQRRKMMWALNAMRMNKERFSSRLYEHMRHEYINPMFDSESKAKHSAAMATRDNIGMTGRKHSAETRAKMRAAQLGKSLSDETKRKLSEINKLKAQADDYVNPMHNPVHRQKHAEAVKNKTYSHVYITPWGEFNDAVSAALASGYDIRNDYIIRLCRNSEKPINKISVAKSKIFTEKDIGKTLSELGFGYRKRTC